MYKEKNKMHSKTINQSCNNTNNLSCHTPTWTARDICTQKQSASEEQFWREAIAKSITATLSLKNWNMAWHWQSMTMH